MAGSVSREDQWRDMLSLEKRCAAHTENVEKGKSRLQEEKQSRLLEEKQSRLLEEKQSRLQEKQSRLQEEKQSRLQEEKQSRLQEEKQSRLQEEKQSRLLEEKQSRLLEEKQSRLLEEKQSRLLEEKQSRIIEKQSRQLLEKRSQGLKRKIKSSPSAEKVKMKSPDESPEPVVARPRRERQEVGQGRREKQALLRTPSGGVLAHLEEDMPAHSYRRDKTTAPGQEQELGENKQEEQQEIQTCEEATPVQESETDSPEVGEEKVGEGNEVGKERVEETAENHIEEMEEEMRTWTKVHGVELGKVRVEVAVEEEESDSDGDEEELEGFQDWRVRKIKT